ncbi:hypothetical protein ABOM_003983 [Aspergillus bombycis]|uniref:Secreted protein CSS2 C-terminal domain-containing protein n=1 Tax=Aspergillus bombycis TaxID=109264 RepID=A0A1F8A7F9_9EURO|nr:hypothetical protein ABOM_003983 [Aspergillus bombycis]OGM47228.1 hypothetical protein ABOM_003983 [Aspergillus bombycis]
MLLTKATVLTWSLFSALSSARPYTPLSVTDDASSLIEGQSWPHQWFSYELDDSEDFDLPTFEAVEDVNAPTTTRPTPTNGTLVTRTNVKACQNTLAHGFSCSSISVAAMIAAQLAAQIYTASRQHDCGTHSGTIDGWHYEYHATGRHCDTTAEQKTIEGAIYKYLKSVEHGTVCGTQCIKLTHGGTWEGYLKFGRAGDFDRSAYCGPNLEFSNCGSGGKNDVP